jgi:hypothetical protein
MSIVKSFVEKKILFRELQTQWGPFSQNQNQQFLSLSKDPKQTPDLGLELPKRPRSKRTNPQNQFENVNATCPMKYPIFLIYL